MRVYRICRREHAQDRTGEGARLAGGRWNHKGERALYYAEHPALCALEIMVHKRIDPDVAPTDFVLATADVPGDSIHRIEQMVHEPAETGSRWLASDRSLLLDVPSVLLPCSRNIVINPAHPRMAEVSIEIVASVPFDTRLAE
ncbi:RES family NAD+ phosphorylase [Halofilum ochraceum]|uniref:RES family NAD+ phosphorylase n=1 Tax=Halofilum ochraceum TaxID=1611323 RepID=UPI000835D5F0|nr:RES family NAD+ phosphorylase [Halofilum ochraceum]